MNRITARDITVSALMAALTALGSFVRLDFSLSPVPVTLQTFFVYLAGLLLGPSLAATAMAVYILMGIAGLPVFAGLSGGLAILLGPTGGYLVGFVLCGALTGTLAGLSKRSNFFLNLLILLPGIIILFSCGAVYLAFQLHLNFFQALLTGVVPYLPGDLLKAALAAWAALKLRRILRK
jgi:biotin transport system substrate-specific component